MLTATVNIMTETGGVEKSKDQGHMALTDYVTLGNSGLRVSPFCLGAMTFGEDWGWGASVAESEAIMAPSSSAAATSSTRRTCTRRDIPRRSSATSSGAI